MEGLGKKGSIKFIMIVFIEEQNERDWRKEFCRSSCSTVKISWTFRSVSEDIHMGSESISTEERRGEEREKKTNIPPSFLCISFWSEWTRGAAYFNTRTSRKKKLNPVIRCGWKIRLQITLSLAKGSLAFGPYTTYMLYWNKWLLKQTVAGHSHSPGLWVNISVLEFSLWAPARFV